MEKKKDKEQCFMHQFVLIIFVKKYFILFTFIYFKNKGEKYVGSWVDGKTIGKGEYHYLNKDKYEGDFIEVYIYIY
jgi:hypothetical protein